MKTIAEIVQMEAAAKVVASTIEPDVLVPELKDVREKSWKAQILKKMAVGDSALFPGYTATGQLSSYVIRVLGSGNYIMRTMKDGVRVWRKK